MTAELALAGSPEDAAPSGGPSDFDAVIDAYRRNVADLELPSDAGVARSIVPAGTAATRDFSGLALQIPELLREQCVGCMACVSACPDAAIIGTAQPRAALQGAIDAFAAEEPDPIETGLDLRAHFATTTKYADVPSRRGLEPAEFGIFVDPVHCKGCGECVEVCAALGHGALVMIDKEPAQAIHALPAPALPASPVPMAAIAPREPRPGIVERYQRDMRFLRTLPITPPEYRNEKALADIMLGEHAFGYVGGAGSCPGCGEGTSIRMMVAATRQAHGPESMGIVAATGCNSVFSGTYPYNPYLVPWTTSLFENAPAVALGIRSRWDQEGHEARRLWVLGGDGAMYDIGFQALSRMIASGADIKVLVLDTQVYSNTGGQSSTASFGGQVTKLSAFGSAVHGRSEPRKELGRILAAHGNAYIAQTTPAHINHFYRAINEANEFPGPAVVIVYAACMPEHGIADDAAIAQARLAVDSRAYPLFTYDPRRGERLDERWSLQGNPALRGDWLDLPNGETVDFLAFARTEGRFAGHFAPDGTPSREILATRDDRLANWRMLQEMAGLRPRGTDAPAHAAGTPAATPIALAARPAT